jgi:hypothetical protein
MRTIPTGVAVFAAVVLALSAASAWATPTRGDCQNDSKLIGPILLSTEDTPGTWWHLTREGFNEAGVSDYKAMIEALFGTTFVDLDAAVEALVDAVRTLDKNGNSYVCATSVRGTRAFVGDPNYAYYFFSVIDDKHV